MKNSIVVSFTVLGMVAVVAGCGGGQKASPSATPTPVPSPTASCVPPAGTGIVQMVYPIPGSSNVPSFPSPSPTPSGATPTPSPAPTATVSGAPTPSPAPIVQNGVVLSVAPTPLPTGAYVYVVLNGQNVIAANGDGVQPWPLISPSPMATNVPGGHFEFYDLGAFAYGATFSAYYANNNPATACFPGVSLGQFTVAPSPTPAP